MKRILDKMAEQGFKTFSEAMNNMQKKCDNQIVNEYREKLLCDGLNEYVKNIKNKEYKADPLIDTLYKKLEAKNYIISSCKRKGGMGASYDFELKLSDGTTINAELKVLNSNRLPQLSDVYIGSHKLIPGEFDKFTNRWINKLESIKKDFSLKENIPSIDDLKKNICKPGTSPCKFLEELKAKIKADPKSREKLNLISKEFIDKFLIDYETNLNKNAIKKVYEEKLNCKDIIIIYNKKTKNFTLKDDNKLEIELKSIELKSSKDGKHNIGFQVKFDVTKKDKTEEKSTIIRLRWKNRNGVYGPAWKLDPIEK